MSRHILVNRISPNNLPTTVLSFEALHFCWFRHVPVSRYPHKFGFVATTKCGMLGCTVSHPLCLTPQQIPKSQWIPMKSPWTPSSSDPPKNTVGEVPDVLPSGKRLHSYGKWSIDTWFTYSKVAIFNSWGYTPPSPQSYGLLWYLVPPF